MENWLVEHRGNLLPPLYTILHLHHSVSAMSQCPQSYQDHHRICVFYAPFKLPNLAVTVSGEYGRQHIKYGAHLKEPHHYLH